MPNIIVPLDETYESITRPTALDLTRQLMKALGLPGDINVDFAGAEEVVAQQNSTLSKQNNKNFLGTNENLTMSLEEEYDADRTLEASVMRRDNRPYFADRQLFVFMRPVYVPTKYTISFVYRSKDEVQVNRWRDDIRARAAMLRSELVYKLTYHHPVPGSFLVILAEIYRLRENQAGYGDTYAEYIKANIDPRVTALSDQTGKNLLMVVPEEQVQILGAFDFAGITEKPRYNKELGVWEVDFNYRYVMDKPTHGAMTYPVLIHQQLLSEDYRPTGGDYTLQSEDIEAHHVGHVFNQLTRTYRPINPRNLVARLPLFDTWFPNFDARGVDPVFFALVGIAPDDPTYVLDLKNLDSYNLDQVVLDFFKTEYPYVTQRSRSLIDVALFTNDGIMSDKAIYLDKDFILRSREPLDLRQVYHVRIGVLTNLKYLRREDGERIRINACIAGMLVRWIFPASFDRGSIPAPSKRCVWTPDQWRDIVEITNPDRPGGGSNFPDEGKGYIRDPQTIMQSAIITWRK